MEPLLLLKPCPFCGSSSVWIHYIPDALVFRIECTDCLASMYWVRKEELIGKWNRRAVEKETEKKMVEVNAIISSAELSTENGYLTFAITVDYGGIYQGFGPYSIYSPDSKKNNSDNGKNYGGIFVYKCMRVAGVKNWNRIVGKSIRVRKQSEDSRIHSIGHIIENYWFSPTEEFPE